MAERSERELEELLARAVEENTPELCGRAQETPPRPSAYYENLLPRQEEYRQSSRRLRRRLAAACVALAVVLAGGWGYFHPASCIAIRVNPSMELTCNRLDRVLYVTPLNQDAEVILDGLDLKNVKVDTAVSAIIGSFVRHDYFADGTGTVHVTVTADDAGRARDLESLVTSHVRQALPADREIDVVTAPPEEAEPSGPEQTDACRLWISRILSLEPDYPAAELERLNARQLEELAEDLAEEHTGSDDLWDEDDEDDDDEDDEDDEDDDDPDDEPD